MTEFKLPKQNVLSKFCSLTAVHNNVLYYPSREEVFIPLKFMACSFLKCKDSSISPTPAKNKGIWSYSEHSFPFFVSVLCLLNEEQKCVQCCNYRIKFSSWFQLYEWKHWINMFHMNELASYWMNLYNISVLLHMG